MPAEARKARREIPDDREDRAASPLIDAASLPPRERAATICDGVIDIVAALFNVNSKEVREPGRSRLEISRVRQIAMYVTHTSLRLSMRDVGQGFGRDRTTVIYAVQQVEDLRDELEFDSVLCLVERVVIAAFGQQVSAER